MGSDRESFPAGVSSSSAGGGKMVWTGAASGQSAARIRLWLRRQVRLEDAAGLLLYRTSGMEEYLKKVFLERRETF